VFFDFAGILHKSLFLQSSNSCRSDEDLEDKYQIFAVTIQEATLRSKTASFHADLMSTPYSVGTLWVGT
jgi:hypothetical protein